MGLAVTQERQRKEHLRRDRLANRLKNGRCTLLVAMTGMQLGCHDRHAAAAL